MITCQKINIVCKQGHSNNRMKINTCEEKWTKFDACWTQKKTGTLRVSKNYNFALDVDLDSESLEQTIAVNNSSVNKTTLVF